MPKIACWFIYWTYKTVYETLDLAVASNELSFHAALKNEVYRFLLCLERAWHEFTNNVDGVHGQLTTKKAATTEWYEFKLGLIYQV